MFVFSPQYLNLRKDLQEWHKSVKPESANGGGSTHEVLEKVVLVIVDKPDDVVIYDSQAEQCTGSNRGVQVREVSGGNLSAGGIIDLNEKPVGTCPIEQN